LGHPDVLTATIAAFAAAQNAVDCPESTARSEAFKEVFNFTQSGEKPRAMAAAEKDGIQAEVIPFMSAAIKQALAEHKSNISDAQVGDFVRVLTSPELHDEAA
jgi:transcription antitermination factor NusG